MSYFSGRIFGRGVQQRKWGQGHATTCSRRVQNATGRHHDGHERGGQKCPSSSRHSFIEGTWSLLLSFKMQEG